MIYNIVKILISAILIALISEVSKRSTFFGAILASIPQVSVKAMNWLYFDTNDALIMNNSFIKFNNITKKFPRVIANDMVSFDIKISSVHALLG